MMAKTHYSQPKMKFILKIKNRGGVLLTTLIITTAFLLIVAGILGSALTNLKLAYRNDLRAQMLAAAESELEWLRYCISMDIKANSGLLTTLQNGQYVSLNADFPASAATNAAASQNEIVKWSAAPANRTIRQPYAPAHRGFIENPGASNIPWMVSRSVRHLLTAYGTPPASTRFSVYDYIEARVIVSAPAGFQTPAGQLGEVRVGRYFEASRGSLFQYALFYDGILELNPGENLTVGDTYSTKSIYFGPAAGKTLKIAEGAKIRLFNKTGTENSANRNVFNKQSANDVDHTTYSNPATLAIDNTTAPTFHGTGSGAPGAQLEEVNILENYLNGNESEDLVLRRPDLFATIPIIGLNLNKDQANFWGRTNPVTGEYVEQTFREAVDVAGRSILAPPPDVAGPGEYANIITSGDDPDIKGLRLYNQAQLLITVKPNEQLLIQRRSQSGALTDVTADYASAISTGLSMTDARETKTVKVTQVDFAKLAEKISTDSVFGNSQTPFNGLIYTNLKNNTTGSNGQPSAVRLINAETMPTLRDGQTGYSFATNGGLYLKGSFNTKPKEGSTGSVVDYPTSMLAADAVTVLSYGWQDGNSALGVDLRQANPDNPITPAVETKLTINAGIITGNVPSTSTARSGGAQNLVRFLEFWEDLTPDDGKIDREIELHGSLSRLFASKHFTARFYRPSEIQQVYRTPVRNITYDASLASNPPPGSPKIFLSGAGDMFSF
jgi:hypothetical protein